MPSNIARYISEFYADLTEEQISSHNFRRRFMFVPVTVNKDAQANEVIEFVRADSDEAKAMIDAYRQVVLKEVERPKYRPGEIVGMMRDDGHTRFSMYFHTQIWQARMHLIQDFICRWKRSPFRAMVLCTSVGLRPLVRNIATRTE